MVINEVFTGQCTDVWNEVCWISCLHNVSLVHVFDNHIQNSSCRISADILDIEIFLLRNIGINIGPKNPMLVGPHKTALKFPLITIITTIKKYVVEQYSKTDMEAQPISHQLSMLSHINGVCVKEPHYLLIDHAH